MDTPFPTLSKGALGTTRIRAKKICSGRLEEHHFRRGDDKALIHAKNWQPLRMQEECRKHHAFLECPREIDIQMFGYGMRHFWHDAMQAWRLKSQNSVGGRVQRTHV